VEYSALLTSVGDSIAKAASELLAKIGDDPVWAMVGFAGHAIFFSRFFFQWLASEKRKESFIPVHFWYLSIVGSLIVLAYAIHLLNPVFIVAYGTGVFIYIRNLTFIYARKAKDAQPQG